MEGRGRAYAHRGGHVRLAWQTRWRRQDVTDRVPAAGTLYLINLFADQPVLSEYACQLPSTNTSAGWKRDLYIIFWLPATK